MLFSRYGQGEDILNMFYQDAFELISYAREQKNEDFIRQRWLHFNPQMALDEFKELLGIKQQRKDDKKVEDILLELKEVFG